MTDLQQYSISVGKSQSFLHVYTIAVFHLNVIPLYCLLKGDAGMGFSRTAVYCDLCCFHLVILVGESV